MSECGEDLEAGVVHRVLVSLVVAAEPRGASGRPFCADLVAL
jgi:hypothetical protein